MSLLRFVLALAPLAAVVSAMPSGGSSPLLHDNEKRSVTCLTVGKTATATWTNSAGQTCTFSTTVGSNFGTSSTGGDYSCNGRCGAGCTGIALGNVYSQDCLNHDICSYFYGSTTGASDPNCGAAYTAAVDDYALGVADGCSQTNPTYAASAPSTTPKCS